MKRGTTPTHTFTIPFEEGMVDKIRIAYAQNGRVLFTKQDEDVTFQDGNITTKLTQEETLAFDCRLDVEMQIKLLLGGGEVMLSEIMRESVDRCLDNEVLK
jgi:hypothetical protein